MDAVKRSRLIKGAIAILVGLPGTVTLFPLAGFLAFGGIAGLSESLAKGDFDKAVNVLPILVWTLSGVVGVIGFWTWIFFARRLKRLGRGITTACVLAGVAAVTPLAFGGSWVTALALLGIAFGLLVCNWLLRPGTLGDPDPPPASPPGQVA